MSRFLLFLCIPVGLLAQRVEPRNELLWEVSGNGLKHPSYLFGSFHSNDKMVYNMGDSAYYALRRADMIVLETDVFSLFDQWDTRLSILELEYDNQGDPYVFHTDPTETYYGNEDGMPQFLDAFFEQYCYNAGKKFAALESVDFQLNLLSELEFTDFDPTPWGTFLTDKDEMMEAYLQGNINRLDNILKESLSGYENGYEKIIVERNMDMAAGVDSLLRTGNRLFAAVGAGHLAGADGLIALMRKKGYHVRKVMAAYSENGGPDKAEVFTHRTYTYINDTLGVEVIFPGKPLEISGKEQDYDLKLIYRDFGQGNSYEVEVYPRTEEVGLAELAEVYIASPAESPARQLELESGGEAWEGLADSYPEGLYWARVVMNEDSFVVIKAYGGSKFMNSNRPQRFFEQVKLN